MSDKKTYENWLVSLDSDNFSMFVKTWFAFLASIRELVLAQARDDEKEVLMAAHGDKEFLGRYKKGLSSIELTPIMQANILEAFSSSRDVVRTEYPEYYFQTYYKKIVPFSFRKKQPVLLDRILYKWDLDVREDALHIGILVDNEEIAQKFQAKYIEKKIPIMLLLRTGTILDNQGAFYACVKNEIQDRLFGQLKASTKLKEIDRLKGSLVALCQNIIKDASDDSNGSDLYGNTFRIWCDEQKPVAMDLKEWFVGFCYSLRNVLFHRTIDPFDNRWSSIMKSCYQGLREFLLVNIKILNEMKP